MLVEPLRVIPIKDVPVGSLFYFLSANCSVLCLAAQVEGAPSSETKFVVPLRYDSHPTSIGVVIEINHLPGYAVILDDAKAEISLDSSSYQDGGKILVSDNKIYMPLSNGRYDAGYLDIKEGIITYSVNRGVHFKDWKIYSDSSKDQIIWDSSLDYSSL
ncbi:hypothetical protein [Altericroceibacterium endophyticum]|uniref:Uncharacterized protein n=1 Tax=Altericroceibacterium endophyticum TaxID=1808508 RepID=A0A6I4T802_9SPHN|nr:hypothetical protein [Altericroceibacterium endophyticum]MXO66231.1 hypothetical protein [Altericroceibacterium endophyticum]